MTPTENFFAVGMDQSDLIPTALLSMAANSPPIVSSVPTTLLCPLSEGPEGPELTHDQAFKYLGRIYKNPDDSVDYRVNDVWYDDDLQEFVVSR